MELLYGETLAARLNREGPFDLREALPLIAQMAAALEAAHAAGVWHCDFKSATGVQDIKLRNATTGAELTLRIDIGTVLADAAVNDPGTEIDLDNFLANVAATNGATAPAAALPGQPGYDPTDPTYYRGNRDKLSLRADDDTSYVDRAAFGLPSRWACP